MRVAVRLARRSCTPAPSASPSPPVRERRTPPFRPRSRTARRASGRCSRRSTCATGISLFSVRPDGSKRMCENLLTRSRSGTPYCSASEIDVANASIMPESVLPSFAIVSQISPGRSVFVEAGGDVTLVPLDRELVRDGGARCRKAASHRVRDVSAAARSRRAVVLLRREDLRALGAVAVDRERLEAVLPALDVRLLDLFDGGVFG